MDEIRLKALAKINLGLDVTGRREDGYHLVRMIMQTIHLFDSVQMAKTKESGIRLSTNIRFLPANENNIAYKAAKLLMEEFGITQGVSIDIRKCIPVSAGMAGGSTDAAAVLYGMNQMFGLKLSNRQLAHRGLTLGADVPYCLMRGTALAEGIGEVLTPLPPMPPCCILVAKPGVSVSTRFVYENLQADGLSFHPDIDGMREALEQRDLKGLAARMGQGNVLETVTVPEYPVIQRLKDTMMRCGAQAALMSGSGPTVFGVFESRQAAKKAFAVLKRGHLAKQLFLTTPYNRRAIP